MSIQTAAPKPIKVLLHDFRCFVCFVFVSFVICLNMTTVCIMGLWVYLYCQFRGETQHSATKKHNSQLSRTCGV